MGKLFTDVTVAQLSKTKKIQRVVFLNSKPWSGALCTECWYPQWCTLGGWEHFGGRDYSCIFNTLVGGCLAAAKAEVVSVPLAFTQKLFTITINRQSHHQVPGDQVSYYST